MSFYSIFWAEFEKDLVQIRVLSVISVVRIRVFSVINIVEIRVLSVISVVEIRAIFNKRLKNSQKIQIN